MTLGQWKTTAYQPVTWQQIWDAATLAERNRLWDEAEQRVGLPDSDRHGAQAYELGRQDGMRAERERAAQVADEIEATLVRFNDHRACGGFGNMIRHPKSMPDPAVLAEIIRRSGKEAAEGPPERDGA